MTRPCISLFCYVFFALTLFGSGCREEKIIPTVSANNIHVVAAYSADAAQQAAEVLGTGWYANIEVDSEDRLHIAYTDADNGDVYYAVSDSAKPQFPMREAVEIGGAVGGYLKLALAPGDVPVLSYYHQDQRTLRLSHREADLAKMKAAGVEVDETKGAVEKNVSQLREQEDRYVMGNGWSGEDVTFGDNVGLGGQLVVDKGGVPHLTYYTSRRSSYGDSNRFRYARRADGKPAFGASARNKFQIVDVDNASGSSYTMTTGLFVSDDGGVAVSYCNWNFTEAQLKMAAKKPSDSEFHVAERPLIKGVDGWHSSIFGKGPHWRVLFTNGETRTLSEVTVGRDSWTWTPPSSMLLSPGAFVAQVSADNTVWVLTRGQAAPRLGESPGVWLLEYPDGDAKRVKRIVLDEGRADDAWLDLALRKNGAPVAVWTSSDHRSMKMYVHEAG